MSVYIYPNAARTAARHVKTRRKVRAERAGVTRRAIGNLEASNKSRRITSKDYFPAFISESETIVRDHEHCYTILHAPNPIALELGHNPSGIFGGTNTKAPQGEYILTRAAIGGSPS